MIEVWPLALEGLLEIRPNRWQDERGFFSEVWRDEWLVELELNGRFVQDNHSYSRARGVLRGMHFQLPPAAQDKLIRVSRGSIFDAAVDVRRQSSTFGRWTGIVLSAEKWNQLFVPRGFAHGFVTLEDDTEVVYKTSAIYTPELERAVRFDDPTVGIDWPVDAAELTISEKDRMAPFLTEAETF